MKHTFKFHITLTLDETRDAGWKAKLWDQRQAVNGDELIDQSDWVVTRDEALNVAHGLMRKELEWQIERL